MDRLHLGQYLSRLVADLADRCPEQFGHLRSDAVMFVSAAARRRARASIRPLFFEGGRDEHQQWRKPQIHLGGVRQRYEIALRPAFFLRESAERRLRVLVHELWHVAPSFDGSLHEDRRHQNISEREEREFIDHVLRAFTPEAGCREALAYQGEVELQAWLHRPPTRFETGSSEITGYDENDLYTAIIEQK